MYSCVLYICIVAPSPSPVDRWRAWDGPATWSHAVVFVIYRPTYIQYTCTPQVGLGGGGELGKGGELEKVGDGNKEDGRKHGRRPGEGGRWEQGGWEETWEETWRRWEMGTRRMGGNMGGDLEKVGGGN